MRRYKVGLHERITLDISGPYPESGLENKYILVAIDYFTKLVKGYAIPNQEMVLDIIIMVFINHFRVPLELHSDQGRNFKSELFHNLCERLGIRKQSYSIAF